MINNYTKEVIVPCLDEIKKRDTNYNWYLEFKNFIAMRIIAVLNLKEMNKTDQLLSLCYLQLFFEINPRSPEDLNNLLFGYTKYKNA